MGDRTGIKPWQLIHGDIQCCVDQTDYRVEFKSIMIFKQFKAKEKAKRERHSEKKSKGKWVLCEDYNYKKNIVTLKRKLITEQKLWEITTG